MKTIYIITELKGDNINNTPLLDYGFTTNTKDLFNMVKKYIKDSYNYNARLCKIENNRVKYFYKLNEVVQYGFVDFVKFENFVNK